MTAKIIKSGPEAWELLAAGIQQVSDSVGSTLGPNGNNVVIDKKKGMPVITNDGVTISKEINLENPFENMGAQLLKEIASKTNEVAGDGTTTATILGNAIFKEGLKAINVGHNPIKIKKGIEKAVSDVCEIIKSYAKEINTKEAIEQVATISSNNDTEIGKLIAKAMDTVGNDGIISVEETTGIQTSLEFVEGMSFDKGFISPYMVTDKESMISELNDPYILVTDKTISSLKDILPILEQVAKVSKPIVFIADNIEGEALSALVVNNVRGSLKALAIKAPSFGVKKKNILEDISIITGAEFITDEKGAGLKSVKLEHLGRASKIKTTKNNTTIVDGKGKQNSIQERIRELTNLIDSATSAYDIDTYRERLAKLSGGVAVIKIGSVTETELKETKYRVEDALSATQAAVQEGIVPGGGTTLLLCQNKLKERIKNKDHIEDMGGMVKDETDFFVGYHILINSLSIPFKTIVQNSDNEPSVIIDKIQKSKTGNGYNARTGEIVDMFEAGIVDPAKVTRSALQNAASIVGLLLTTSVLIARVPGSKKEHEE